MKKLLLLGALAITGFVANATAPSSSHLEDGEVWLHSNVLKGAMCSDRSDGGYGYFRYMFDDNLESYWHQKWDSDVANENKYHWFSLDLGKPETFHGFDYWARNNSSNGRFLKGKIFVSNTAFDSFANDEAAKAYYDEHASDAAGSFEFTYSSGTDNSVKSCRFEEVTAQHVLVILESTTANHACGAEFKLVGHGEDTYFDLPRDNWVVTPCSDIDDTATSGRIKCIYDDNINTYWNTDWQHDKTDNHWFIIDMGEESNVDGFKLWRRYNDARGEVLEGKVYVSKEPFAALTAEAENDEFHHQAVANFMADEANVPAAGFTFEYDSTINPDQARICKFDKTARGRYVLVVITKTPEGNAMHPACLAEFKLFKDDAVTANLLRAWNAGLNSVNIGRASALQALGSFINKGVIPSTDMPDDVTVDNIDEKLAATNAALDAYVKSFENQLIYIRHGSRRNNAYLAALPTGKGVKFNTIAEPTADAVWQIRFLGDNLGFYLYSRTTNMWINTQNGSPSAATAYASMLTSRLDNNNFLNIAQGTGNQLLNVDGSGNDLVWYGEANDGGSQWTVTAITVNDQVYVDPEVSTAEAPQYYRLVNARWMHNKAASNMAVNGENQDGAGNGETNSRANSAIPGIYWRIESCGEGVKLINLTGYELTYSGTNLTTLTDNGSIVYLMKQTDSQFNGVNVYGISNNPAEYTSYLDVSDNGCKFVWNPVNDKAGNGNNGSAWYFLRASDEEIANATATYIAEMKSRMQMLVADRSLIPLFGEQFYSSLGKYDVYAGDETIDAYNALKVSGDYSTYSISDEKYANINNAVNGKVSELTNRHFLVHNRNANYSKCYLSVSDGATAPTANANDLNALWSFVPDGEGYLMTSAATGNSLSFTKTGSVAIPVVEEGLPYSIAYNANIPGFYFTLIPTDEVPNVAQYAVHQSNNDLVCKWYSNDIAGSHWYLEVAEEVELAYGKTDDGEGHYLSLPAGVALNRHATANNHVITIAPKAAAPEGVSLFAVEPIDGVHTIAASDFNGNKVELTGLAAGEYTVSAPAGMFIVNGKPSAAYSRTLAVDSEGIPTGVEEVAAEAGSEVVYDLQGRRVNGNAKGLLIVNGRKVFVK